jgi:hypothetical protein
MANPVRPYALATAVAAAPVPRINRVAVEVQLDGTMVSVPVSRPAKGMPARPNPFGVLADAEEEHAVEEKQPAIQIQHVVDDKERAIQIKHVVDEEQPEAVQRAVDEEEHEASDHADEAEEPSVVAPA